VAGRLRTGIEGRDRLYFDNFCEIPVAPPPLEHQRLIADVLDLWDDAIAKTERLIAAKRKKRLEVIKSQLLRTTAIRTLGGITNVVMGQSPSSSAYNDTGNGLPLIQGAGDFDEWGVHPTVWTTQSPKQAPPGAIIMSVRAPVGLATLSDQTVCLGRGVCALIEDSRDDAEYILASLLVTSDRWTRLSQGTSFDAIGADQFDEVDFPWPAGGVRKSIGALHRAMFDEERYLSLILRDMRTQKRGIMQRLIGAERLGEPTFFKNLATMSVFSASTMRLHTEEAR
jgi:type I restriction enzyme, S subunit